jgi:hypothetical protein
MAMKIELGVLPSSFRDPGGFLFRRDGVLYRQINDACREDYDCLMQSGLCEKLVSKRSLIPHKEVEIFPEQPENAYLVILIQGILHRRLQSHILTSRIQRRWDSALSC